MQKLTIPYEILFRFGLNDQKDGGAIKGAHYKNLTIIMDEGEVLSEKEGPAQDLSVADPVAMTAALGAINVSVISELAQVKGELSTSQTQLDTLKEAAKKVEATLLSKDAEIEQGSRFLKESQDLIVARDATISQVNSEKQSLSTQLDTLANEKMDLQSQLSNKDVELQAANVKIQVAETQLAEAIKEVQQLRDRLEIEQAQATPEQSLEAPVEEVVAVEEAPKPAEA